MSKNKAVLMGKTKFNDVKEQSGLDGPNLFSNYNF